MFTTKLGVVPGLVIGIALSAAGAMVGYYVLLRFLHHQSEIVKVIATFLLGLVIVQVCLLIWGTDAYYLPYRIETNIELFGGRVPLATVVSAVGAGLLLVSLQMFFSRSRLGIGMRALADNETLVMYRGTRYKVLSAAAWAVSTIIGCAAALVYAQGLPISTSMWVVGLAAFPGAVIGGLDSVTGAVLGSFVVAVISTLAVFYINGSAGYIVTYGAMIASLLIFPYGILGRRRAVRL
jgi:branched-chain amino acid transport system permease protein